MIGGMSDTTTTGGAQWFGHPRGLSTLFFTEMWERFSYYGMRALLVLFMTEQVGVANGGLGMTVVTATAIYALYTFSVYVLALPGGWIADRLIGQRRAVLVGGVIIAAGHYTLAVPALSTFYLGLILVVLGTGLLKPNVSAIVADLYPEGGARRDAGFSVFYMGINIGALFGTTVCPFLGEKISWHLGFSAAGIGMTLGLIQYVWGGRHLGTAGGLKGDAQIAAVRSQAWRTFFFGVATVAAIAVALIGLSSGGVIPLTLLGFVDATGYLTVSLATAYFAYVILFGGLSTMEKKRVGVIAILFVGAAMFWAGFEQAGSAFNLFALDHTDRMVFGWEMPAGWLQNINPFFIVVLAPVSGMLWIRLGSRNPSIPAKFGYGLVLLGVGFFVLAWGSTFIDAGTVSPMWLVVTYFFHTVGELCLSPIGLSSVTKLSPPGYVSQMMGTWFMGAALGNLIAGRAAGLIESLPLPQIFGTTASIVVVSGLLFFIFSPLIRKMTGDIK